jgi:hypothetical protein
LYTEYTDFISLWELATKLAFNWHTNGLSVLLRPRGRVLPAIFDDGHAVALQQSEQWKGEECTYEALLSYLHIKAILLIRFEAYF